MQGADPHMRRKGLASDEFVRHIPLMTNSFATYTDALRALVLRQVDDYARRMEMSDSGISRSAVGDSEFVGRLRRGENVTVEKLRRLELWLKGQPGAVLTPPVPSDHLPSIVSPAGA
ncbi:hypothetical protein PUR29_32850 [Methylobacterium ajmalii]|uniref:Uncharacterized protein n=1 Tax=Methylobacterium ajmalii TaxID=2738439 RepID=A0ABV0A3M0_9HYPH